MGSRYGKATPVLLSGIAIVLLCILAVFVVRRTDTGPISSEGRESGSGVTDGMNSPGTATDSGTLPERPPVPYTESDAQRLKEARARLHEVISEDQRLERELQGARYAVLKSNPELKARLDQAQALNRELAAMISELPERIRLDRERDQGKSEQIKVNERINEFEKKVADARAARQKALEEGRAAPVEESSVRQWLTELKQARKDAKELQGAVMSYFKEVKKLELESKANHPQISQKAAEAEQIRREVTRAVSESNGVATRIARRNALNAERDALIRECSQLTSRSNRVVAAAEAEGKS